MTDKSWKAVERKAAKSLGTERNPLSGGNSKITRSDSRHEKIFLETKQRANFNIVSLFRKTELLARKESKIPVLCLKSKGKHGEVAVIDWKLFLEMWEKYQEKV